MVEPEHWSVMAALRRACAEVMLVRVQKDFDDAMEALRVTLEDEGQIEQARAILVEFARANGTDLTPYLDARKGDPTA